MAVTRTSDRLELPGLICDGNLYVDFDPPDVRTMGDNGRSLRCYDLFGN